MTHPHLVIPRAMFRAMRNELRRRGGGERESGAFLLTAAAASSTAPTRIDRIAYYDDLDPHSLTGGITFHSGGYTNLARLCRAENLRVVADIHTHPAQWVQQSSIDASHPMSAIPGHIAIICPHFAQKRFEPADCGIHIYRGALDWDSRYGKDTLDHVSLTGRRPLAEILRHLFRKRGTK